MYDFVAICKKCVEGCTLSPYSVRHMTECDSPTICSPLTIAIGEGVKKGRCPEGYDERVVETVIKGGRWMLMIRLQGVDGAFAVNGTDAYLGSLCTLSGEPCTERGDTVFVPKNNPKNKQGPLLIRPRNQDWYRHLSKM